MITTEIGGGRIGMKALRVAAGLSLEDAAARLAVTPAWLELMERGSEVIYDGELGARLADVYGIAAEESPLTDEERRTIQARNRGRDLGNGRVRNFCCVCGMPLEVPRWMGALLEMTCDEHARPAEPGPAPRRAVIPDDDPSQANAIGAMEDGD